MSEQRRHCASCPRASIGQVCDPGLCVYVCSWAGTHSSSDDGYPWICDPCTLSDTPPGRCVVNACGVVGLRVFMCACMHGYVYLSEWGILSQSFVDRYCPQRPTCSAWYYCADAAGQPVVCSLGRWAAASSGSCSNCPAGVYGSTYGLTVSTCTGQCAGGYYCPEGSIVAYQMACPAGTYRSAGVSHPRRRDATVSAAPVSSGAPHIGVTTIVGPGGVGAGAGAGADAGAGAVAGVSPDTSLAASRGAAPRSAPTRPRRLARGSSTSSSGSRSPSPSLAVALPVLVIATCTGVCLAGPHGVWGSQGLKPGDSTPDSAPRVTPLMLLGLAVVAMVLCRWLTRVAVVVQGVIQVVGACVSVVGKPWGAMHRARRGTSGRSTGCVPLAVLLVLLTLLGAGHSSSHCSCSVPRQYLSGCREGCNSLQGTYCAFDYTLCGG